MKIKILNRLKQDYAHLGLDENTLSGLADMLATSGLVTDENIEGVIANQKAYLEGLQKSADKRVQEAVAKQQKKASEAADAAKAEHDKAVAELQKQLDELKAKADDEKTPPADDKGIPDWYKAEKAEREKQMRQLQETITSLQSAKSESDIKLKAIEEARASEVAARAAKEHHENIGKKAKEKGIPDWMIKHGFADIPADADDAKIDEILTGYANEIQTNFLPGDRRSPQFDGKQATKEEIGAILDKILPPAADK